MDFKDTASSHVTLLTLFDLICHNISFLYINICLFFILLYFSLFVLIIVSFFLATRHCLLLRKKRKEKKNIQPCLSGEWNYIQKSFQVNDQSQSLAATAHYQVPVLSITPRSENLQRMMGLIRRSVGRP